jgi:hypothetical protein
MKRFHVHEVVEDKLNPFALDLLERNRTVRSAKQ